MGEHQRPTQESAHRYFNQNINRRHVLYGGTGVLLTAAALIVGDTARYTIHTTNSPHSTFPATERPDTASIPSQPTEWRILQNGSLEIFLEDDLHITHHSKKLLETTGKKFANFISEPSQLRITQQETDRAHPIHLAELHQVVLSAELLDSPLLDEKKNALLYRAFTSLVVSSLPERPGTHEPRSYYKQFLELQRQTAQLYEGNKQRQQENEYGKAFSYIKKLTNVGDEDTTLTDEQVNDETEWFPRFIAALRLDRITLEQLVSGENTLIGMASIPFNQMLHASHDTFDAIDHDSLASLFI